MRATRDHILFDYNFTLNEVLILDAEITHIVGGIANNQLTLRLLKESDTLRFVVVLNYNTLYYKIDENKMLVTILSFFSNRQNPKNRKNEKQKMKGVGMDIRNSL